MEKTAQTQSYNAKQLDANQKKRLALQSMKQSETITRIAKDHQVSRKFIYQQKNKATQAVNDLFEPPRKTTDNVFFYLPVTWTWLCQLILCLVLHCRASHRGIQNMVNDAKVKVKAINAKQDLTNIKLAAQDEMFHYNKRKRQFTDGLSYLNL